MKRIEIKTAQNVTIEYELASLRERILAFFIDFVIVQFAYYILIMLVMFTVGNILLNSDILLGILLGLMPLVLFLMYQFFSEIVANGQTIGKKAIGIKVARLDGREPGMSEYLLRTIFHLVDTFFSVGIIGTLLIGSSSKNQRLGDITSNTTVIKLKSNIRFNLEDILKISTLEDYEPQYPEVKQLSEQDMLLIKETLERHRSYKNLSHNNAVNSLVDRLSKLLDIQSIPKNKVEFLKTLIRDYIVLTR